MTWSRLRFLLVGCSRLLALARLRVRRRREGHRSTTPKGDARRRPTPRARRAARSRDARVVRRRLPRPGPARTTSSAYVIDYAIARRCTTSTPGSQEEVPVPRRRRPRGLRRPEDGHGQDQEGRKFGPPVNRDITTKDIKYAFERFFSANVGGQYPGYFQPIVGAPKKPTEGVKRDLRHRDAGRPDARLQAQPAGRRRRSSPALVMPITIAGARGVRASKHDAKNPSTYNTHVVATGPVHGQERQRGQAHGLQGGQEHRAGAQPELGRRGRRAIHRPAYVDRVLIRTNASDANVSARQILDGQSMISIEDPPANILREVITRIKDQYETGLGRRVPLLPDEHDGQAVRRPQRPQGGHGRLRPRGGAPGARRQVHRADRHALAAAGLPGPRRVGRPRGLRVRLLHRQERQGRPGGRREVLQGRRLQVRQVRGRREDPDGRLQRRPGQGPVRGRQGPAREDGLQGAAAARPAGLRLHRVVPGARPRTSACAAARRGARTSTTRSR